MGNAPGKSRAPPHVASANARRLSTSNARMSSANAHAGEYDRASGARAGTTLDDDQSRGSYAIDGRGTPDHAFASIVDTLSYGCVRRDGEGEDIGGVRVEGVRGARERG